METEYEPRRIYTFDFNCNRIRSVRCYRSSAKARLSSHPLGEKKMIDDPRELTRRKQAEIDIWEGQLKLKVREYVAKGMSHEYAEQRAAADIGREIARS
jgi:hypothetical protein